MEPQITETPVEQQTPSIDLTAGYTDGQEVENVVGALTGEIIVFEYDEQGNQTGWHKEVKQNG